MGILRLNYGEAFARMGVPGMGRRGAPWCGIAPDGVLVFMAHQSYFRHIDEVDHYVDDKPSILPPSPSARLSHRMLADYYGSGKRSIRLIVGIFESDGDEAHASRFGHASGIYYEASLTWVGETGLLRAICSSRLELPPPLPL